MSLPALDAPCRFCGQPATERHHAINRSLGGHDGPQVELCLRCHRKVHDKKLDTLSVMDPGARTGEFHEQAEAARIIGLERAHRLLAPSAYPFAVKAQDG